MAVNGGLPKMAKMAINKASGQNLCETNDTDNSTRPLGGHLFEKFETQKALQTAIFTALTTQGSPEMCTMH